MSINILAALILFFFFFFDRLFIEKVRHFSLHPLLVHWAWGTYEAIGITDACRA
jgi:hypothetical protein